MTDRRDPLVLMIGIEEEWASAQVEKELDSRGVRWTPLNVADFPLTTSLEAKLTPDNDRWWGTVHHAEHELSLADVTAVLYGRPTEFVMPPGLSGPELRFSRAQARVGLGGVLAGLAVRWVSHPSALADAAYKPWQLARLKQVGLTVPPTLVTNDAEAVRDFAAVFGELIVKPLAESIVYESGGEALVYTRRVQLDELDSLDGVESTAHLFQQFVWPKLFEARVTAVGDRLFPVAIHAGSERAQVDWRTDYDALRYEVIDVPDQVRAGIARYLEAAGLAFCAFDFAIGADGVWYCLEGNSIGAWGWLAEACDLPIASAIADALIEE
jgi:glutathione synthase/RimK-type ligase-like ATP-grasp enzyme